MSLNSPRTYLALAAIQAGDAAACAVPIKPIAQCLRDVEFPLENRWILVAVKAASAVGLASAWRYPALARLTTFMLTVYFVFAVGYHVRARDLGRNALSATTLLVTFAALTARGPAEP